MSAVDKGPRTAARQHTNHRRVVVAISLLCALVTLAIGIWSLVAPESFAAAIGFPPYNEHLLHDVGAFQIGIGASLVFAVFWTDALGVALAAFVVGGGIHTLNHVLDLHLGGHEADQWALGALTVLALVGLLMRLRTRG